jgi:hypothetical protein
MAIVIDAQGNLVDTEGRINFFNTGTEQFFPNQDINQNIPEQTSKAQLESALGPGFYPERGINTLRFANTNSTSLQPDYLLSNTNKIPEFTGNNSAGIFTVPDNDLEENAVTVDELGNLKQSGGIADVFRALIGFAVPGANFFLNQGSRAMDGIRSLNQRIQQSDFGRSKTLADYFDAKSYGGRDARDRAASQNMREARAIQTQVDRRGDSTSRIADRNRSSVTRSSAAKSRGVGGGGYTASDSARERYRGG